MLEVGIIGCGNAGNQVCGLCATKHPDIPVIAINCSENDLATLPDSIKKVTIGDGRGAGKNREEAKAFLEKSIMDFVTDEEVREFLSNLDIVFIVSSTGGGTGSGISILLSSIIKEVCSEQEVPVLPIPVGIIPTLSEALSTQANTLGYLTELYNYTEDMTYMLYDNGKIAKNHSTVDMMRLVNEAVVEDINILRGYYNRSTPFNTIDERDAMTLIGTPGRIVVGTVANIKESDIDDGVTIENLLLTELKRNAHAEMQLDGIVNRTGIVVNLSETLLKGLDTHVPQIQQAIGSPVEEFEHIVVNADRKVPNQVSLILSGLSNINDRIAKIKDRIEEINAAQDRNSDESELDDNLLQNVNKKRVYRDKSKTTGIKENVDLQSIFNRFKK